MKNKKIWWFLLRFFGTYFLLFLCYSLFLSSTEIKESNFVSDPITQHVAKSTGKLLNISGVNAKVTQHPYELSFKLLINENYVARVIEGCNAMSVIILFIAFIIAFKGTFKKTIVFVLLGSVSIYVVNVIRIALLSYAMMYFKEYEMILHDLLFPAIIYGYIFLLWVVWINKFSNLNKN